MPATKRRLIVIEDSSDEEPVRQRGPGGDNRKRI
jgi:hypothetical protein